MKSVNLGCEKRHQEKGNWRKVVLDLGPEKRKGTMKKKTGGRLSLRGGCFGSTGGTQSLQHRPTFPPTCFAKTKPMRKNIFPPISLQKKTSKRQKM